MTTLEDDNQDGTPRANRNVEFETVKSELKEPRELAGRALSIGVTVAGIISAGAVFADIRLSDYGNLVPIGGGLIYLGVILLAAGTTALWGSAVPQINRSLKRLIGNAQENRPTIQKCYNWYQVAIGGLYLEILGALLLTTGIAVADRPESTVIVERIICC